MPSKPAQGHRLQVKISSLMFLWTSDQTIPITIKYAPLSHQIDDNRKRSEQMMNAKHKSLETVFWIAICRQLGHKRQSKIMFLKIFDLRSSIV